MSGSQIFAGLLLPESVLHTPWFTALTTFVAVNTVLYLTLAIVKLLPKPYLSDWTRQRNRRSEPRGIYPTPDDSIPPTDVPSPAATLRKPGR